MKACPPAAESINLENSHKKPALSEIEWDTKNLKVRRENDKSIGAK